MIRLVEVRQYYTYENTEVDQKTYRIRFADMKSANNYANSMKNRVVRFDEGFYTVKDFEFQEIDEY